MKEAIEILYHEAQQAFCGGDISDATFSKAEKCHDWRNHVPFVIKKLWGSLSEEARLVSIIIAEEGSDREEWE